MEEIKEESQTELEKVSKKSKTVILHNRELSEDEQHLIGLIFPKVIQFTFNFHCGKDLEDLILDGQCLIVNISKKNRKTVSWFQDQKTDNFNVIVVASKLKKKDKQWLIGSLGMISNIKRIITNAEQLYASCGPLEYCSGLFCCF
jgi:hypothetical protein